MRAPILVGFDGGTGSKAALDLAMADAELAGSWVVALHVRKLPLWMCIDPPGCTHYLEAAELDGDPVSAEFQTCVESSAVPCAFRSQFGNVAGELVRVANELDALAVVVGPGAHSRIVGRLRKRCRRPILCPPIRTDIAM
jgi:nucleotide-binding universal stress UspA family protein